MQTTQLVYVEVKARFGNWQTTFVSSRIPNVGIIREAIDHDLEKMRRAIAEEETNQADDDHDSQEWCEAEEGRIEGVKACRAVVNAHEANVEKGFKNVNVAGTTVGSINVATGEAFVDGR
ncbi:MAG: hypothetical protein ACYS7Y_04320 [Planctomycetota bacterium]|jgi:hypothetical protein